MHNGNTLGTILKVNLIVLSDSPGPGETALPLTKGGQPRGKENQQAQVG